MFVWSRMRKLITWWQRFVASVMLCDSLIVMNLPNGTNDLVTLKPWGPTLVDNRPLPIEPLAHSSPATGLLGTLLASLFLVQCSMWLYNHRPALANRTRLCSRLCQSGWGPEKHIRRCSLNSVAIHPNWLDNRTKTPHVPLQLVASTTMTRKLSQPSRVTDLCLEHRNSHSAIHEIKNTMKKHKQQRIYNISKFCLRLSAQLPCPPWFESERNAFIKLMLKKHDTVV